MNDINAQAASRGLLLFSCGTRCFALPDSVVQEVVPAVGVCPLPFTPSWVAGLVNIAGRVLPQISLAHLLGEAEAAQGELLVLQTPGAEYALRVDQALARIEVAADSIQAFASGEAQAAYVCAELQHEAQTVLLLDVQAFDHLFLPQEPAAGLPGLLGRVEERAEQGDDSLSCLLFSAGAERYGMPLAEIREIADIGGWTAVPGAPAMVLGLSTLRQEPLLLVSLAQLLGLAEARPGRVALVLEHEGLRVALLLSQVEGMATFARQQIRPLSAAAGDVSAVLHDAWGQVLGLLGPARLLRPERRAQWQPFMPARRAELAQEQLRMMPFLQIQLGRERLALALDEVRRILPWHAPEAVADDAGRVSALVNVEGEVLPVLAAERLHQQAQAERPAAWVVVNAAGGLWALAVDAADAIIELPETALETVSQGQGLVSAVAQYQGRLLSVVSLASLGAAGAC